MPSKPHHIGAWLPPAQAGAGLLALVVLSTPAKGQVTARQADAGDVDVTARQA
jgi:hypothetical protein